MDPEEQAFAQEMMGAMPPTDPEYSRRFLTKLSPEVRAKVAVLQGMDKKVEVETEAHNAELLEVKKKYNELAKVIHAKRTQLLTGATAPSEEEVKKGFPKEHEGKVDLESSQTQEKKKKREDPQGLPGFWLKVLDHHKLITAMISPRDREGLEFLSDITIDYLKAPTNGFTLSFHFATNPYFSESVLTKAFLLKTVDGWNEAADKTTGCQITWFEGKNLCVEYKKKKQRSKKGQSRSVTKEVRCSSFFDFFCSWGEQGYTEEDLQVDYAVADVIRSKMIPYAVDYYTGQADNGARQMNTGGPAGMGGMMDPEAMMGGMMPGMMPGMPGMDPSACPMQ